jgi:hypothetical protein
VKLIAMLIAKCRLIKPVQIVVLFLMQFLKESFVIPADILKVLISLRNVCSVKRNLLIKITAIAFVIINTIKKFIL